MQQIAFATFNGAIFYLIFRKSGLLIVPMILHGLWDFSIFIREANIGSDPELSSAIQAVGAIGLYLPVILFLFALRHVNVKSNKKAEATA
jgi:membrane protease YdiL (CAAX protease family)